jgi:sugar phosphate isomerase/epimerase
MMLNTERRAWNIALTATPDGPRQAPVLLCGDIPGAFRHAANLGCQGVEIHIRRAEDLDSHAVKQLVAGFGLEVPTLGTGMAASDGLSFSDPRPGVRAETVERVRGHIEFAAEIGSAVTIGILSGNLGECAGEERLRRRSMAIASLAKVCELARRLGVTLLLEPLNRYECDHINTLADGMRVVAEIGAPNLKLLADTFHMNIEEADVLASLKAASSIIGHVHLADTNRQAPGHGHLDVAGILEALSETGYEGYLAFEVFPLPDARTAIRDGITAVRAAAPGMPRESNASHAVAKLKVRAERSQGQ